MPDDNQTRTFLSTANAYALSNIRWIIDKIETHGNPVKVDLSDLSIEHIMPQTGNDYWRSITKLSDDDYTILVNKLGNLTLAAVSDNSKMGNNDFDYKKSILKSTKHLILNSDICSKESWTIEDINNRTTELIEKILVLFPYVQTKYSINKDTIDRDITLTVGNISALGHLNKDNSLIVYSGSEIKFSTAPYSIKLKELREDLYEQEIIKCVNGRYIFEQDYIFTSPSAATDFILGGSNNGWIYWKDKNGRLINDCLRNL